MAAGTVEMILAGAHTKGSLWVVLAERHEMGLRTLNEIMAALTWQAFAGMQRAVIHRRVDRIEVEGGGCILMVVPATAMIRLAGTKVHGYTLVGNETHTLIAAALEIERRMQYKK